MAKLLYGYFLKSFNCESIIVIIMIIIIIIIIIVSTSPVTSSVFFVFFSGRPVYMKGGGC